MYIMTNMTYYKDHTALIETISRIVDDELAPKISQWEKDGRFPDEVFQLLGQYGFLGILIPEQYEGIGGDYKMAAAWCESFGRLRSVGLTVAVNMHSLVISHALARYGSKESKDRWLKDAVGGKAIGAYAFTEPSAGSDLANLRTKAEKRGDKWILNGSKTFITNGARADFILVLARTDPKAGYKGFTTFVVDTSLNGFHVSRTLDKLGWLCSDTAELVFDGVEIPDTAILGNVGEGWSQASTSLNWERLMLTLTSLAGAKECFNASIRYSRERTAFGKALYDLSPVKSILSEMYQRVTLSEAISHHALDLLNLGKECRAEVSVAKRKVCDEAVWIADRAIQIHGGYGYTQEFSPERWWRDLRLMPIGGGTSEIMANIVGKEKGW